MMKLSDHKKDISYLYSSTFTPEVIHKYSKTHFELILSNINCLMTWTKMGQDVIESLVDHTVDIILSMPLVDTTYIFVIINTLIELLDLMEKSLVDDEYYESCFNIHRFRTRLLKITEQEYDYDTNRFI